MTSLEHRARCLVHTCFVDCQSEGDLVHMMHQIKDVRVDLGTESGISDAHGVAALHFL